MARQKNKPIDFNFDGLEPFEEKFLQAYMKTQDYDWALSLFTEDEQEDIKESLMQGSNQVADIFNKFSDYAPTNPKSNRLSILKALNIALEIAIEDKDTNGIVRCTQEINKMVKGNLAPSAAQKGSTTLVGLIDLSKNKMKQISEGKIFEVNAEIQDE